jgi:hypothetical protein
MWAKVGFGEGKKAAHLAHEGAVVARPGAAATEALTTTPAGAPADRRAFLRILPLAGRRADTLERIVAESGVWLPWK